MAAAKSAASIATTTAKNLLRATDRKPKITRTGPATASPPIQLQLHDYCFYYDTAPPTQQQLQYGADLFRASNHSPIQMWTASEFRTIPMSDVPEVVFLGRSNVGKSSLLNAIMEKGLCFTSSKVGRTRTLNAYGIGGRKDGEAKVVLVDTPGYGKGSHEEWGEVIMKYLTKRRQLRRTFVLLDSHHGIKPADAAILSLLRSAAVPHQVILSKADSVLIKGGLKKGARGLRPERIKELGRFAGGICAKVQPVRNVAVSNSQKKKIERRPNRNIYDDAVGGGDGNKLPAEPAGMEPAGMELGIPALGEILACSTKMKSGEGFLGIDAIRWSILRAAGLGVDIGEKGDRVGMGIADRGGGGLDG
ncbi:GTP-binding protein [Histoplasma capsulatum H143]|uniref:GTP-binding protein n=1 Tax=Ajellomyces capsulatus (strain H143) TaxID=544712 RepID=C6H6L7_AJECH|nr:GTP-binding protein [Histoplasma capsulatum H143]